MKISVPIMPLWFVEVYNQRGTLADIRETPHFTKQDAQIEIEQQLADDREYQDFMRNEYAEQLRRSVLDLDDSDFIPRPPHILKWTYKAQQYLYIPGDGYFDVKEQQLLIEV